ncbi:hypothetical protein QJV03_12270 [Listeria swaminathanii]|uniref:Uncharacterized protein n=1 Tax=Listeria swaminathanii TaxID=2713501 RepID=A0ABU2IHS4_9LIST|nr:MULTISPECIES: hypothetical protein [Listeria]MBF2399949.1 hypothetical protein [Listeria marthii]MDT0004435.1 hypothetical protein [Listeria cossartiae subsp. cayugensis]MDT0017961.1 hypothetical protein [Listeria swaminathanii]MDT0020724.1 hypothetical protein [Listeria cossartiae subsp. cayugensis]MDT0023588.1 hypothetical protein [Listeria swaminathanii]
MDNIITSLETFSKIMFTVLSLGGIGFLCTRYGFKSILSYGSTATSISFSIFGTLSLVAALIVAISNGALIFNVLIICVILFFIIKSQ